MRSSRAISGVTIKNNRREVKKISEITATLPFSEYDFCNRMFPLEGEIALMLLILHLAAIHVVEIVARGRLQKSKHTDADGYNNHNR